MQTLTVYTGPEASPKFSISVSLYLSGIIFFSHILLSISNTGIIIALLWFGTSPKSVSIGLGSRVAVLVGATGH
jgi:hypothetical protein